MLSKMLVFALFAYVAWWLWQHGLKRVGNRPPPEGFSADPEKLVRCDRCGVRVPASQIAAIRANCRQCADER